MKKNITPHKEHKRLIILMSSGQHDLSWTENFFNDLSKIKTVTLKELEELHLTKLSHKENENSIVSVLDNRQFLISTHGSDVCFQAMEFNPRHIECHSKIPRVKHREEIRKITDKGSPQEHQAQRSVTITANQYTMIVAATGNSSAYAVQSLRKIMVKEWEEKKHSFESINKQDKKNIQDLMNQSVDNISFIIKASTALSNTQDIKRGTGTFSAFIVTIKNNDY